MRKKILYQKLIKSLLDSDFLLIEQKHNKNNQKYNSRFINNQYSLNNKHNITYLDIFEVIKDLKQFARIIFFIKKHSLLKKKINFFIDNEKNYLQILINNYFDAANIKRNFSFDINSHYSNSSKLAKKSINLGILLDNVLLDNKNFFKNQFNRDIFLFLTFNSIMEQNLIGYKIYNNTLNYKKTLFFLSFLRQIFITYAISKKI